jgi:transcription termination factor NusB
MKTIFVSIDENNIVAGFGSTRGMESEIAVEIDDEHQFLNDNPFLYKLVDGTLEKLPQEIIDNINNKPSNPTPEERITQLENVVLQLMMEG